MNIRTIRPHASLSRLALCLGLALASLGTHAAECTFKDLPTQVLSLETRQAQLREANSQYATASAELDSAQTRRLNRLSYIVRVEQSVTAAQASVQTLYGGVTPDKVLLAQQLSAQTQRVTAAAPALPETPERTARLERLRELNAQLHAEQSKSGAEFNQTKGDSAARSEVLARAQSSFAAISSQAVALQQTEKAFVNSVYAAAPDYLSEKAKLDALIRIGELEDKQALLTAAKAQLEQDRARVAELQRKVARGFAQLADLNSAAANCP